MLRRRPDEDEAAYQLRVNRFHALSCVSLAAFMTIPLLVIEYMRNSRQTTNQIAIIAFIATGAAGGVCVLFGAIYGRADLWRALVALHTPPRAWLVAVVFAAALVAVDVVRHCKHVWRWKLVLLWSLFGACCAYWTVAALVLSRRALGAQWPRHKLPTPLVLSLAAASLLLACLTSADVRVSRGEDGAAPPGAVAWRAIEGGLAGAAALCGLLASAAYGASLGLSPLGWSAPALYALLLAAAMEELARAWYPSHVLLAAHARDVELALPGLAAVLAVVLLYAACFARAPADGADGADDADDDEEAAADGAEAPEKAGAAGADAGRAESKAGDEADAARRERRKQQRAERAAAAADEACWGPVRSALWAVAWTGAVCLACAAAALRYSHARPGFTKKVLVGGGMLELAVLACAAYVSATCGPTLLASVDACAFGVCCCCCAPASDEKGGCCAHEKKARAGPGRKPVVDEHAPLVPTQPTAEAEPTNDEGEGA